MTSKIAISHIHITEYNAILKVLWVQSVWMPANYIVYITWNSKTIIITHKRAWFLRLKCTLLLYIARLNKYSLIIWILVVRWYVLGNGLKIWRARWANRWWATQQHCRASHYTIICLQEPLRPNPRLLQKLWRVMFAETHS